MVDQNMQEVIDDWLAPALDDLLQQFGLELPPGVTSARFLAQVLEGGSGIGPDPALFSWFGVKIMEARMGNVHANLSSELRSRIAQISQT